ncbi:uncharacterized protein [Epargyreus clarus]|uniref:uncharacterized protein n=1 Tax=Epargyreus clarus TaxID=520877 RepID=UPI003C2FA23C
MIPRFSFHFNLCLCVILLSVHVRTSFIKDALEDHHKDIDHNESAESVKHDKQKGEKFHQIDSHVDDKHTNQHSKANDEAKYLKKDHDSKSSSDSDSYGGYNDQKDKSEDSHTNGFKKGHKKGHHKQGFQNSYHKDESSNKSTYFDDFNDEEDQAGYNSRQNSHDNQGNRKYQGAHNNGQEYLRNNYRNGGYNRHGDTGNRQQGHQDYGRKHYLDDTENYNKFRNDHGSHARDHIRDHHQFQAPQTHEPQWDWQRWDDRRRWERPGWNKDYGGPGYYDDYGTRHDGGYGYGPNHGYGYGYGESRQTGVTQIPNTPIVAHRKQTITIYEDPRYTGEDGGQLRREDGDYIQLDYQPSSHRYASYDTYYNAPSRTGAESSKINKLVYNYRRH